MDEKTPTADSDGTVQLAENNKIPFFKLQDTSVYTEVALSKSETNIKIEMLDFLQKDLEELLSNCAIRLKILNSRINGVDLPFLHAQEKNKGSLPFVKPVKPKAELNSVPPPRTSASSTTSCSSIDNFWHFTKPYCRKVAMRDVNFLDDLICESLEDVDVKPSKKRKKPTATDKENNTNVTPVNVSSEIQGCLKELAEVSSNNLQNLLKLKAAAIRSIRENK